MASSPKSDAEASIMEPRRPRLLTRLSYQAEEMLCEWNWLRFFYHLMAYIWICFMLWLAYIVSPFPGHWQPTRHTDKVPIDYQDLSKRVYFGGFQGFSECNIRAGDLYIPPRQISPQKIARHAYCSRREDLLEAMSNGGRLGFDEPYFPKGCHYRWYSVEEICMILERFDAIVFVGDYSLQSIYNGFNILLRRDLARGALKTWEMNKEAIEQCRCDRQLTSQSCAHHFVTSSEELLQNQNPSSGGDQGTSYTCQRTPHAFLSITSSPSASSAIKKFESLVPRVKPSNYHPVPIIHSLSPNTVSSETASSSLLEFLSLADSAKRKTPMLWIGPTAAGHVDIKDRKGNQEIWDFDKQLARAAEKSDVDVLGMWNMTVQATSWDGMRFGEKVAVTQAMMVVNWLARLPSS